MATTNMSREKLLNSLTGSNNSDTAGSNDKTKLLNSLTPTTTNPAPVQNTTTQKATLINDAGQKVVVDVGSTEAQGYFSSGYKVMGADGKAVAPVDTTKPPKNEAPITEMVTIKDPKSGTVTKVSKLDYETNPAYSAGGYELVDDSKIGQATDSLGNIIKQVTDLKYADRTSPEVQEYEKKQTEIAAANKETTLAQYKQAEENDLQEVENSRIKRVGELKSLLASRGLDVPAGDVTAAEALAAGVSTQAVDFINDLNADLDKVKEATKSKYQIMRLDLDAKTKQSILDNVNKEIERLNKNVDLKIQQYQQTGNLALGLVKEMNTSEIEARKAQLQADENRITEEYNNGKITIDAYNAEQNKIKNERDALLKAEQLDINRFNAETQRIKATKSGSAPRVDFNTWANQRASAEGKTPNLADPQVKREWIKQYYAENPVTVKDADKYLTTEQQQRSEIVQAKIENGTITLEQAQDLHPDIAYKLHRKGLSALEKLILEGQSLSAGDLPASITEEPVNDGTENIE